MSTPRKSKWFVLIAIGLLIVVLPNILEHLGSYKVPEVFEIILMTSGITLEVIGLILIRNEKRKNRL